MDDAGVRCSVGTVCVAWVEHFWRSKLQSPAPPQVRGPPADAKPLWSSCPAQGPTSQRVRFAACLSAHESQDRPLLQMLLIEMDGSTRNEGSFWSSSYHKRFRCRPRMDTTGPRILVGCGFRDPNRKQASSRRSQSLRRSEFSAIFLSFAAAAPAACQLPPTSTNPTTEFHFHARRPRRDQRCPMAA